MPIPTKEDYALSEISDLSAAILAKLSVMRHAHRDARDIRGLHVTLEDYIDRVEAFTKDLDTRDEINAEKRNQAAKLRQELGFDQ